MNFKKINTEEEFKENLFLKQLQYEKFGSIEAVNFKDNSNEYYEIWRTLENYIQMIKFYSIINKLQKYNIKYKTDNWHIIIDKKYIDGI